MIISVHLPKTAGSSFGMALEEHFGNALLKDYSDFPINTPVFERNLHALQASIDNAERDFSQVSCIQGHFLPLKYLLLADKVDVKFITWIRDPVERLASHYWYWKRSYDPSTSLALHKQLVEENWSLERFCLGPEMKNFYWQFLWGFALERFDFVGIAEHYAEDFAYFTKAFIGVDLPVYKVNVGDKQTETSQYITDQDFRQAIEAFHSIDVELYRRAAALRLATRGVEG